MKEALVISTGLAPQVITEMLWWLAASEAGPQVEPDTIHVITTKRGKHEINAEDVLGSDGKIAQFCNEFDLPRLHERLTVHVPADDARDVDVNTAYADCVTQILADLTTDPQLRIHACLAGGYKVMSFYMGYAMSLLGRDDDRLYHIFVTPGAESDRNFWWKPKHPRTIRLISDGIESEVSTDDVTIDVVSIPFVRMRYLLPKDHLIELNDFGRVVMAVDNVVQQRVELTDARREVRVADQKVVLPPKEYALYRLLAERCRERTRGAGPDGIGDDHEGWVTMEMVDDANKPTVLRFRDIWNDLPGARNSYAFSSLKESPEKLRNRFSSTIAKANTYLKKLGPRKYEIAKIRHAKERHKLPSRFGLTFDAEQINIFAE